MLFPGSLSLPKFEHSDLKQITDQVESVFYDDIIHNCLSAGISALTLQDAGTENTAYKYIIDCNNLSEDVRSFIQHKKQFFLAYVRSLAERDEEGHDCRNCGSGAACSMNHGIQMNEYTAGKETFRDLIGRLEMATLPIYAETIYPDGFGQLRNLMVQIEHQLTDLLHVEEVYFLPRIKAAQKNIYAHH